ncbi:MAG: sugar phosphate isomerase/epimerase [Castellaniella sp.]|uniref:sugar phosphate isomerase/epimerase family protein n=1 Tax=Castellaniella sp. TaxID=1955812 RepID=UPI0011FC8503|nr:sugar phosphate isomerase/epimerase family protein [Castellaniella sp.]TAN30769.1 MAG: sugar phosphate isomerase/epimerase [Castellaniella sp.]
MNRNSLGLDLACLAGSLEERLTAAKAAGFSQVMLWARDLVNYPSGYHAALERVHASRLRVTGLQLMRNYEGMNGPSHEHRLDIVKALLDVCVDVGAPLLLVRASAAIEAQFDPARAEADLCKLANLAVPTGVRIGFKAIPWSHSVADTAQAWELVSRVRHANLGLVLDAFHFIAGGRALESLNEIPPEKILLVQLADFGVPVFHELGQKTGDHLRVFPGDGVLHDKVAAFVRHLDWLGYDGDYSLLVFNEDYQALPAQAVAQFAARSAAWVNTQVLRRRLPLNRKGPGHDHLR